jgi:hypothetical protein
LSLSPASRGPSLLLALVVAVGCVETLAAARAYRSTISESDLETVTERLLELPRQEVRLGTPWLRPRLLQHLPADHNLGLVAADESGLERIWVVVASGQEPVDVDVQGVALSRRRFGGLDVLEYAGPGGRVRNSLVDADELRVEVDGRRCRNKPAKSGSALARRWDCRPGGLQSDVVEVAYRPRRCLRGDALEGRTLRLELPAGLESAGTLRGHLGFGDFNSRLRSDAQVAIRVLQGERDELRADFIVSDDEGWRPFELALPAGGPLAVELRVSESGSFDAKGRSVPRPAHHFCFEARVLDDLRSPK